MANGERGFRSAARLDRSRSSALLCRDASRAKQEFKEESDINVIVKRFGITGKMPVGVRMPQYGDFTGISSFHEAANAIAAARESFDAMPAEVRSRFNNDPEAFVAFCGDDRNRAEAVKLGLVPDVPLKDGPQGRTVPVAPSEPPAATQPTPGVGNTPHGAPAQP